MPPHESRWFSPWVVGSAASLLALGFGAAVVFTSLATAEGATVLPRVHVAGIDVGGMTREQAQAALSQPAAAFTEEPFELTYVGADGKQERFAAQADDLGLVIDVDASVEVAYGVGHRDNFFRSLLGQVISAFGGTDADAVVRFDAATLETYLGTEFLKIESPARDARLAYESGSLKVLEGRSGSEVDAGAIVASLARQAARLAHESISLQLVATTPAVAADQLGATKELATRMLSQSVNFYLGDANYAPPKDVVGSWLEFHTVRADELLGRAACDCGLPAVPAGEATSDASFDTPAMLVTPTEQERRGEKPTEPYYVLLPRENFRGGSFTGSASRAPLAVVGINRSELQAWLLDSAAAELDVPGTDARFAFSNGAVKVTTPSTPGTGVDVDAAMRELLASIAKSGGKQVSIKLAMHQTKPAITEDIINDLGIKELIGRGITDASGSPANRFVNIDVGLQKFDGTVIAPGETFSTLDTLGPIDGAHGFLPELVITGNKIEPQYGGGLCQVSSTLFRAALETGLDITERTNHAFVVDHYVWPNAAPGWEATIFEPDPDLEFINDTDNYILIHTYRTDDDKVVFEFYGTDPERTSEITAPYWLYGGPVGGGKTLFTYTVTDNATGNALQDEEFVSVFQPLSKFKRSGQ